MSEDNNHVFQELNKKVITQAVDQLINSETESSKAKMEVQKKIREQNIDKQIEITKKAFEQKGWRYFPLSSTERELEVAFRAQNLSVRLRLKFDSYSELLVIESEIPLFVDRQYEIPILLELNILNTVEKKGRYILDNKSRRVKYLVYHPFMDRLLSEKEIQDSVTSSFHTIKNSHSSLKKILDGDVSEKWKNSILAMINDFVEEIRED